MPKVLKPLGPRVIVKDIASSLSDEEKWKRAGLQLVTEQRNQPRNTMGIILAIGTDPILTDAGLQTGDLVFFGPHAGTFITVEDTQFRSLEFQEIISHVSQPTATELEELGVRQSNR